MTTTKISERYTVECGCDFDPYCECMGLGELAVCVDCKSILSGAMWAGQKCYPCYSAGHAPCEVCDSYAPCGHP